MVKSAATAGAMRLVILESPYAGDIAANTEYARAALRDALARGEAPIASHLLYTQPGVLREEVPNERQWGIDAGLAWVPVADATVVYTDLGISRGMKNGIAAAQKAGRPIEYRTIKNKGITMETLPDSQIHLQDLWEKYEDVAIHFNDLLMRLRSQSLAGIAALSTAVGVLTKSDVGGLSVSWFVAGMIFSAMALFWVAIWCLDFLYYNRLLVGAVTAIRKLEAQSSPGASVALGINLSTLIEDEFKTTLTLQRFLHFRGVLLFYGIVLVAIMGGAVFCLYMHGQT